MHQILTLFLLAGALGTDATSMAIGIGMTGISKKHISITSILIGVFHVLMPLLGLYLGRLVGRFAGDIASYVGAAVLILLGLNMIKEAFEEDDKEKIKVQKYKTWTGMIVLAIGVSLDAFSVGFSLGTFSQLSIPVTVITLGIVAGIMTAAGFVFGKKIGSFLGEKAVMIGGIILVLLGIKILLPIKF